MVQMSGVANQESVPENSSNVTMANVFQRRSIVMERTTVGMVLMKRTVKSMKIRPHRMSLISDSWLFIFILGVIIQ